MTESKIENKLPQEGPNIIIGESLTERGSVCSMDSGGNTTSINVNSILIGKFKKAQRTRSLSLSDIRKPKGDNSSHLKRIHNTGNHSEDGYKEVRSKRGRESPTLQKTEKQKHKQQKILNWLSEPPKTMNPFDILPLQDGSNESVDNVIPKTPKIPPIFVCGVEQIQPLINMLNEITNKDYTLKNVNRNQVKIQLKTNEHYSAVANELKTRNTEFHSFQLKTEKRFKAVIVNLHHSTDKSELKAELQALGHDVVYINNVMKRGTRTPLPVFILELKAKSNNKSIYDIQYLMHSRIKIEPPRQKREIVQCTNCQRYGHTKSYCNRQSRCVKCAQQHNTKNCTRTTKDEHVKCVLCEGRHPANYRGCTVYQEIRQRKFPQLRKKENPKFARAAEAEVLADTVKTTRNPGLSYAQITREPQPTTPISHDNQENSNSQQSSISRLEQIMESLLETMNNLNKMMNNMMTLFTALMSSNAQCPKP